MNISENGVTFDVTLAPKNPKSLKLSMVRSKGLEPSRLLGTTTSRLRVYQFHHERISAKIKCLRSVSEIPKNDPLTSANTFSG